MTLDQLPLGQIAKVLKLTGAAGTRRRLMEMGITPATAIEAIRWAPLGDPLDVKVRGYHLSLRREEAAAVEVSVAAPSTCDHLMRIIAGQFRGHSLAAPPVTAPGKEVTRPITDRAKQSLFDALQDCFAIDGGGTVLDCFSGTGSLGLECLSRGAAKAIFVERDRGALIALKKNLADLDLRGKAVVLPIDAYHAAEHPDVSNLTIAFVDPPYAHTHTGHLRHKVDELLRTLAQKSMIDGGIISFRHPANVSVDAAALGTRIIRELSYGDMAITWLIKA